MSITTITIIITITISIATTIALDEVFQFT